MFLISNAQAVSTKTQKRPAYHSHQAGLLSLLKQIRANFKL